MVGSGVPAPREPPHPSDEPVDGRRTRERCPLIVDTRRRCYHTDDTGTVGVGENEVVELRDQADRARALPRQGAGARDRSNSSAPCSLRKVTIKGLS